MTTSGFAVLRDCMDAIFDLVGDVRNHLYRFAEIIASALLVENGLINLAAGEIVNPGQFHVGEPLVVAEVEIGFRAVIQHVNFAVLIRAHRARIDVQVGIEFLQRDFEAAILEQRAERGGGQSFAQRTHHAASNKNVFHFRC